MTAFRSHPMPGGVTTHIGHVLDVLRARPARSWRCVVTSPPYWGLRDYGGLPQIWGGDPKCEHAWTDEVRAPWANGQPGPNGRRKNTEGTRTVGKTAGQFCAHCGAWFGHLGLEPHPDLYVSHIVEIFREVNRILTNDGTIWVNIGDCYATGAGKAKSPGGRSAGKNAKVWDNGNYPESQPNRMKLDGLKKKDLVGIPWRVALALQADGWHLRGDIIWDKRAPLPENVNDRPSRAHEYIFLLTKRPLYYCNMDAIAEPTNESRPQLKRALELFHNHGFSKAHLDAVRAVGLSDAGKAAVLQTGSGRNTEEAIRLAAEVKAALGGYTRELLGGETRNCRTIWTIPTIPYPEAHFATFPPELPRRCILAGSEKGDTVADIFGGSGTTAMVARELDRKVEIVELNPGYLPMIKRRLNADQLVLGENFAPPPEEPSVDTQQELFGT